MADFLRDSSGSDAPFLHALVHAAAGRRAVWPASFPRRLMAGLLDVLAFSPIWVLTASAYVRWSGGHVQFPHELAWYDAVAVTFARHFGFMLGFWGMLGSAFFVSRYVWIALFDRTPGMILLRLAFWVHGHPSPGPLRLCLREMLGVLSFLFFAIGPLWAIFDESNRSLADVVTGIYLVSDEPRPS